MTHVSAWALKFEDKVDGMSEVIADRSYFFIRRRSRLANSRKQLAKYRFGFLDRALKYGRAPTSRRQTDVVSGQTRVTTTRSKIEMHAFATRRRTQPANRVTFGIEKSNETPVGASRHDVGTRAVQRRSDENQLGSSTFVVRHLTSHVAPGNDA